MSPKSNISLSYIMLLIFVMVEYTRVCGEISSNYSIVMTMIIRDEEVNLKDNLPLWLPIVQYFVFLVDTRTKDNSIQIIHTILNQSSSSLTLVPPQYRIIPNRFDGFGSSRTKSLHAAYQYYPNATHVWVSDPDWKPDMKTIQLSDLDLVHDVFGFISFDRTGITTRTMHWILRQRPGLKMRYNLHEVLDIGDYSWKNLQWTIYEVEKNGSWHTTVGHGHSMSQQRFQFDITLLEKDLIEYGHDSHTHYYLGVTHDALASTIFQSNGYMSDDVEYHLMQALKYLKLRVESTYPREYVDDRVNCMMLLGNIYSVYLNNFITAEYWYHLCYEFDNKKIPDCGVHLINLYLSNGLLNDAITVVNELIKLDKPNKIGISHYKIWDCDLPRAFNLVFSHQLSVNPQVVSKHEAMYMLILDKMIENNKLCSSSGQIWASSLSKDVQTILGKLMDSTGYSLKSSVTNLCNDGQFGKYITQSQIKLHPCDQVRKSAEILQSCKDFLVDIPPISEDMHVRNDGEFIGGFSIPDIIHHIFQGNYYHIFVSRGYNHPFRVLFAEYFNVKCLLRLYGYAQRHPSMIFDVVVITSNQHVIDSIKNTLNICSFTIPANIVVDIRLQSLLSYIDEETNRNQVINYFDYIEYNGGLGIASSSRNSQQLYDRHLYSLRQMLSEEGVIGITYFTCNIHQQNLFDFISQKASTNQNKTKQHIPFSNNRYYLLKTYLTLYDMDMFMSDSQFLLFYGINLTASTNTGYDIPTKILTDNNENRNENIIYDQLGCGHCFRREDVIEKMKQYGYEIQSWLPSAISHPYEELQNRDILQFQSIGIDESNFIEKLIPNFRYTIYVTKNNSNVPGRATVESIFPSLSNKLFYNISDVNDDRLKQIVIVDRIGSLGLSFENSPVLASQNIATHFSIGHYSVMNSKIRSITIREVVSPSITWILPHLSSSPSIYFLMNITMNMEKKRKDSSGSNNNINISKSSNQMMKEQSILTSLINLLRFLEHINYITFRNDFPTNPSTISSFQSSSSSSSYSSSSSSPSISIKTSPIKNSISQEIPKQLLKKVSKMRDMGYPDTVIDHTIKLYEKNQRLLSETNQNMLSANDKTENISTHTSRDGIITEEEEKEEKVTAVGMGRETIDRIKEDKLKQLGIPDHIINKVINHKTEIQMGTNSMDRLAEVSTNASIDVSIDDDQESVLSTKKEDTQIIPVESVVKILLQKLELAEKKYKELLMVSTESASSYPKDSSKLSSVSTQRDDTLTDTLNKEEVDEDVEEMNRKDIRNTEKLDETTAKLKILEKKSASLTNLLESIQSTQSTKSPSKESSKEFSKHLFEETSTISLSTIESSNLLKSIPKSTSGIDVVKQISLSQETDAILSLEMMDNVVVPSYQTFNQILNSFRSEKCIEKDPPLDICTQPSALKRKTSGVGMTSLRKLKFDISQLKHILNSHEISKYSYPIQEYVTTLENMLNILILRTKSEDELMYLDSRVKGYELLNRALFISVIDRSYDDSFSNIKDRYLSHTEALHQLHIARSQLDDHDFIVIDVLIQNKWLSQIRELLLGTTIWFDYTNGRCFASHYDDGLLFIEFRQLAKEMAAALSSNNQKYSVQSYHTLALETTYEAESPFMIANEDEIYAILWITSSTLSGNCNVHIYDTSFTSKLYTKGISIYPSVHPDFLSFHGNLTIDINSIDSSHELETISGLENRLIILNAQVSFFFRSKVMDTLHHHHHHYRSTNSFTHHTCLAFVVKFSSKQKR